MDLDLDSDSDLARSRVLYVYGRELVPRTDGGRTRMTRREALRVRAYDGGASSFLGPPLATSSPVSRRMAVRMELGMPTACGRVRFEAWGLGGLVVGGP